MPKYQVNIYHGGEMRDETYFFTDLELALKWANRGEHSEVIELSTNKLIFA